MSMKKILIFINCLILITLTLLVPVSATEDDDKIKTYGEGYLLPKQGYETEIALLVNSDTDTVIFSKNADKITAPASLTKIVTAMVALNECKDLQKVIKCSYNAIHSLDGTGSSVAGLFVDEEITLEMLLYCLLLPSANDAAAVIAEHFGGGDTQVFVDKMNALVKSLGCKNTYFANAHGLDDESVKGYEAATQNRTTARDMYLIAKEALKNDTIVAMSSKYGKTIPATNKSEVRYRYNTNPLLNDVSPYYYKGAVGLKTGTTDKAGCCLISSATKDGYTYISIAMRGVDDYYYKADDGTVIEQANTAFLMCRYMLGWAFSNMKMKVITDENYVLSEAAVKFGRGSDYVGLVTDKTVNAIVHNTLGMEDFTVVLDKSFSKELDAPVKKGDVITTASIMYESVVIAEVELVAFQTIKKNYLWAAFSWMDSVAKFAFLIILVLGVTIVLLLFSTRKKRAQKKRRKNQPTVIKDYSNLSRK